MITGATLIDIQLCLVYLQQHQVHCLISIFRTCWVVSYPLTPYLVDLQHCVLYLCHPQWLYSFLVEDLYTLFCLVIFDLSLNLVFIIVTILHCFPKNTYSDRLSEFVKIPHKRMGSKCGSDYSSPLMIWVVFDLIWLQYVSPRQKNPLSV